MPYSRICISSTGGSGGKTLFSLGLARALRNRGLKVKTFKKGPDYIDAAWLGLASGRPATNLDPFFLSPPQLSGLFSNSMAAIANTEGSGALFALIEGNRGLYDGLDETGSCSTAAVARIVDAPVLLCLNCAKTTRTMAAILSGLIAFEKDLRFAGVIINRAGSPRHEQAVRKAIETYTDVPVLGALPRLDANPLPERHMGLASTGVPGEEAQAALEGLAALVEKNCDIDAILAASHSGGALPTPVSRPRPTRHDVSRPRIGYVHDAALWFHYPENMAALEDAGCEVRKLSLLDSSAANAASWQGLAGLCLGGGFPEDYAAPLSKSPWLGKIAALARAGMPIYAECGGLILCCQSLEYAGTVWPMAGIFPHRIIWGAKPAGLGYVEGEILQPNPFFPVHLKIRGHEFHYSCLCGQNVPTAMKLSRGTGLFCVKTHHGRDGLAINNVWAAYTHIFAPSVPCWAINMAAAAKMFSAGGRPGKIVAQTPAQPQ